MAVAAACTASPAAPTTADPSRDKLAQILHRGTLVEYFEADYAPQSYAVEGVTRAADTRCAPNELTAAEVTGFDNEITKLIAADLGVEACFVSPTWTEVTGGNWGDRWDIAYGSGAINATRMEHLWMTQPYYYIPQRFIVREDAPFQVPSDLDGKAIGTCTSCTVESYLKGTLEIPGVDLRQKVRGPSLVGFETEGPGIDALVAGGIDAFLAAEPVGRQAIDEGKPLRLLDEPAFSMYPSGFIDKGSALDTRALFMRINEIVAGLHRDGKLRALSEQFFGVDYTTEAAAFDLAVLGQTGP
ncbi:MAG TPA: transporter substrate-binding domain-containing protein [Candidatus Limnocylindrales bacterium]|nr:transporter substrate-binding domain-containing protein [Candidatus Limnocylindrales bacterium]